MVDRLEQEERYGPDSTSAKRTRFNQTIDKVGYFKDEILVSKCRLLEDQELKIVGGLEDFLDLDNFIGLKSCVPLISKHSPLAVSIAMHMHYNVNKHENCGCSKHLYHRGHLITGYGHIYPLTLMGQLFTIIYALFALGVFFLILANISSAFANGLTYIYRLFF